MLIITLGSFVASAFNGAFATGGIYIMLAASSSVLPLTAAIALQPAFVSASLVARIVLFWQHIDWRITVAFVLGCIVGIVPGAKLFSMLDESVIAFVLGAFLLVLIWWPAVKWRLPVKQPFFFIGCVHSVLGTIFGAGAVLQPSVLRTGLGRLQITGTLAACLLVLDAMKATSYTSLGFRYQDYLPHIVLATLAGFLGTWVGKKLSDRVSEELFRTIYKILVSVVAIRLLYRGLVAL